MFVFIFNFLILLWLTWQQSIGFSRTNFHVKKFSLCNNTQGLFEFHGNMSQIDGKIYADGYVVVSKILDDNIGSTLKIDTKVDDSYIELFVVREKSFCKAANAHLGEMWYDMERAAGAIPGLCPIPAKRYNLHHASLDFRKMSLQTFPFGVLRFIAKLVDHRNPGNNLICLVIEVDNVAN